jgi:hypothetical protein
MTIIADILLVAGAFGAAFYCFILSRRLARFNDLEGGVGGAVAALVVQVDDMTRTLELARSAAGVSTAALEEWTGRGEQAARQLELLLASMHDLPEAAPEPEPEREARLPGFLSGSRTAFVRHGTDYRDAAE